MPEELNPPSPLSICEEVAEEPEHIHYIERQPTEEKPIPSYMKSTYTRNRKALKDLSGEGAAGGFGIKDGDEITTHHQKNH
jgi:hypothetical protein|tara:strand:+ start:529 stop:771 length:243 start_codon:yes stop_codon:yes gene_type:complete